MLHTRPKKTKGNIGHLCIYILHVRVIVVYYLFDVYQNPYNVLEAFRSIWAFNNAHAAHLPFYSRSTNVYLILLNANITA